MKRLSLCLCACDVIVFSVCVPIILIQFQYFLMFYSLYNSGGQYHISTIKKTYEKTMKKKNGPAVSIKIVLYFAIKIVRELFIILTSY